MAGVLLKTVFNSKAPPRRYNDHANNDNNEECFKGVIHNLIFT